MMRNQKEEEKVPTLANVQPRTARALGINELQEVALQFTAALPAKDACSLDPRTEPGAQTVSTLRVQRVHCESDCRCQNCSLSAAHASLQCQQGPRALPQQ